LHYFGDRLEENNHIKISYRILKHSSKNVETFISCWW